MTADGAFHVLVYLAYPAAVAYPLIYAARTSWWRSWVGRALLLKAVGIAILLTVSVLYQAFGPHYPGRDVLRITGMALVSVGLWYALLAMLREFHHRDQAKEAP